jgi:hypothetical protein
MNDPASYTFDWRRQEHARVSTLLVRELFGRGVRRVLKWIVVAVWTAGVLLAAAGIGLGDAGIAWRLAPLLALVGVMLLVFYPLTGWLHASQVGRHDPNVAHPITHTLNASGLDIMTRAATVHVKWEGMHKVRETDDMFLFYYTDRYAYFLPKRAVGATAEVDALRDRIGAWLPADTPYERDS